MKQEARKWLARGVFVALVALGTLIAGPELAMARECPYPSAGTCPPLVGWGSPGPGKTCPNACADLGWTDGGSCVVGCCVCYM